MFDSHRVPLAQLVRFIRRVRQAARYEVYAYWRRKPVDPRTVLYESFAGNGMLCNPEALFRALRAAPDLGQLRHVWVLSDPRAHAATIREFARERDVRFVRPGSRGYYRALATSGYLVNNATFPPEFSKRPGQVYLNTWHGTPLKRMGYDIRDGAAQTANTIRNFIAADYLLAANGFMAEQMYESAYKLGGIYRGRIIEEGYPRIDRQFQDADGAQAIRDRLEQAGVTLGDRRIILYAPTWKGTSFILPKDDAEELFRRVSDLEALIDTDRYVVLLKTHQVVHRFAADRVALRRQLVPNEIPTNLVLGITDILITDYSSIFFDFLSTGRPILFLAPDFTDYAAYRGLYLEPSEWPGPVVRTIAELATEIAALGTPQANPEIAARYLRARERFSDREDGAAASRVIDIVFRNKSQGYRVRTPPADRRVSILLYLGGMRPNGITTSALNMLNQIDHENFDVSAFFAASQNKLAIAKQRELTPAVRQLARVGGMNGSKLRQLSRHLAFRRGNIGQHSEDARQRTLWDDEWTRCFGDSRFDYVVDFSGYGPFWAALVLHSPPAQRSIWLHNDMVADSRRLTNGRRRMQRSLGAIFSLYRDYDHLVSVSPALAGINRQKLAAFAHPAKFVSALNVVNAALIRQNGGVDLREVVANPFTGELPDWAEQLLDDSGTTTFVCVGRLSPEKNHARLLRAFARVHAETPSTRLLLVGDGPLYRELENLVVRLGLGDAIFLTGHQANPHAIMARADCFVLSSDYEGQPMVILEALVLRLPVVTVAFGSVLDAVPEGSGLVVPATDEGLAEGLRAYLRGAVPASGFDDVAYNREAIEQFYRAIGARR
ncbi:MAG: CDP-glycerol glycerophosphotransferase family protein [Lacisediminihabitans sp.]